ASTKAQKIILAQFPEVKQVVNKIGSGEIPTDPMPIEAGDMMIILKDKKEWTSASSREELAEKMQEALSVIPGVTFGFQQPIQMRFNELITGAKQDVVIKIYGEDLDVLTNEAAKIGKLISPVEGVNDVYVEEVTGLPQIRIKYNRDRIAQYGLNINAINRTIKTAFAGEAAGVVYEGEKRFDLVVRLDKDDRQSLQDVRGLYVTTRTGQQMPLEEVAAVDFVNGPNQIQRDDTKRRITIGFNVRNRDVESIVEEIQKTLDNKLKLPPGYYTTYGGQFENLKAANARLAIALPVALFLILILLYFTFRSVSQSLLIFTAIPLSAIGGVFALLIRGMSFSISAGVGFIALFGVAVLNGIVLIAEFNRLKKEGIVDVNERVLSGTKSRLRPVLMTAAVASLGFLPMAISNSSGAEVQRPLATVVIGGLITATLLTLIVLPVLYILFERKRKSAEVKSGLSALSVILILLFGGMLLPINSSAQSIAGRKITLDQAIDEAVKNNSSLRAAIYEIDIQKSLKKGSVNLDRTSITYQKGQINSSNQDNHFLISQKTEFPTVYSSQSRLADQRIKSSERFFAITENDLIRQVKSVYYELVYLRGKERLFTYQDSLYSNLVKASDLRYRTGESNRLEKVTSETQLMELKNAIIQNQADILIAQNRLQTLLNTKERLSVDDLLIKRPLEIPQDSSAIAQNPYLKFLEQEINVRRSETSLQQARRLPDFTAGYFNQSFQGLQNVNGIPQNFTRKDRFMGFQIGIGIPILPGGNKAKINASKISEQIAAANFQYHQTNLQGELQQLIQQYNKHNSALDYYEKSALAQADLIIQNAEKGFKGGEIAYLQYLQSMSISIKIKSDYMQELFLYNQSVLDIENIIGKK
ncbi:MAG: CusA/CzcA family heavy metal efflux RND transporter, partial [Sphingobacteriales bacterium 24-40-4]